MSQIREIAANDPLSFAGSFEHSRLFLAKMRKSGYLLQQIADNSRRADGSCTGKCRTDYNIATNSHIKTVELVLPEQPNGAPSSQRLNIF
jgi:hypothetical protein